MKTKNLAIRILDGNGVEISKEVLRMSLLATLLEKPTVIDDNQNWIILRISEDNELIFEVREG